MEIKISEQLFAAAGGSKAWKPFGVDEHTKNNFSWRKFVEIELDRMPPKLLRRLAEMVEPHEKIRGAGMALRDIRCWMRVLDGDKKVKARTVAQFASLLKAYLAPHQRHHVYERDKKSYTWLPYYVEEVQYHPAHTLSGGGISPAHVTADLFWMEFAVRHRKSVAWWAEDCLHFSVTEALANNNLVIESDEMRAEYLADVARWTELHAKVGLQLRGRGLATDDLDGNPGENRWSRWDNKTIILDKSGQPARLLVDVFRESDKEERESHAALDEYFWARDKPSLLGEDGEEGQQMPDEDLHERPSIEVPIHAKLAVFDLARHLRLRVHVGCVEVYEYDKTIASKLVLPKDSITLIEMLISSKGVFKDIVAGKSGGSVVLCCGRPGVGKTLTAEVYSESMERPLYSVQCSQLGTTAEELEGNLVKVFARSQRWNAILLLDEADVYVMERGANLEQNAIVGVFLRVLEYYAGTMFLTTNRADRVDDAVASRCVARIEYELPPEADQRKLWCILSETAGVKIPAAVIEEAVRAHKGLSGRDIKNVVKLAGLMSASSGQPVTSSMINFVKRFKPTKTD